MQKHILKQYQFVVVGGGLSGVCAAIAAARHGLQTALIHNRPVLGGNASSEVRMHVCGAGGIYCERPNARETGIIEELLLENKMRNPYHSFSIFDTVLWEKVRFQKNLDLYLNTNMLDVEASARKVSRIKAYQYTTEKHYIFEAEIFADTTGDGSLAIQAGCAYMRGRESKDAYNEPHAPETADSYTMGNSILFKAVDRGCPVPFVPPQWAIHFSEEDLRLREHGSPYSGYWWIELGGDMDVISDFEEIRDNLLTVVYGVWDHIKNGGKHGAENLDLDWVQFLPGKRESNRIVGEYVLREQDIVNATPFQDVVAYGGWPIDLHIPHGIKSQCNEPTEYIFLDQVYGIPYRSLVAKGFENLLIGGRAISATHVAFASTRCMGTTSVIGQAIGTAAYLLCRDRRKTLDLVEDISELQQILLEDDCYLPGIRNLQEHELCRRAIFTASSEAKDCPVQNLNNGVSRPVENCTNCWTSLDEKTPWVMARFEALQTISKIILKFDSNLNEDLMITLEKDLIDKRSKTLPTSLIKDFEIELFCGEKVVHKVEVKNNHIRSAVIQLENPVRCDAFMVTVNATYGQKQATIFEIRAY